MYTSELRIIIKNFKDDTAAGYDKVTAKIFKSFSELIIIPLVYIYNSSILNSIFPNNKSLLWLKSYLSNRQQMVKLNDVISNASFIKKCSYN